jgi:hypothetical protein
VINHDGRPTIVDTLLTFIFEDVAGSVSLSLLAIKASNNQFMTTCNLSPPRLPMIHDQQSLTLRWCSFHDGVGKVLQSVLCMKVAKNSFMTDYNLSEVWFPRMQVKNRWHSVDAHFQDGAGRVLQSVLPIKAAKNCIMTDGDLSAVWFPRMHDEKSLMLSWRIFSTWGQEHLVLILAIRVANTWIIYNNERFNFKWPDLYDL